MNKKTKKAEPFEISRTLVLSTIHMTKHDNELLGHSSLAQVLDYGYRIFIGEIEETFEQARNEGLSCALCQLMFVASQNNCTFLELDCDGQVRDAFAKFDW